LVCWEGSLSYVEGEGWQWFSDHTMGISSDNSTGMIDRHQGQVLFKGVWIRACEIFSFNFSKKGGLYATGKNAQSVIMKAINEGLGELGKGFSFVKNKLTFTGTVNVKNTNIMFWALLAAVNSETKATIQVGNQFVESTTYDPDTKKTTKTYWDVKSEYGGGRTDNSGKVTKIYIMADAEYSSYSRSDYGLDGKTPTIGGIRYYTQSTIFWHELGHFLIPGTTAAAVNLENEYRSQMNMDPRPYDSEHMFNQNLNNNWSYQIFYDLFNP
jgi:hypothetical protein